jgi:hypothetical protein
MTAISVNDPLRSLLPKVGQPLAFQDEQGHVIGYFTLLRIPPPENLEPRVSEEELQRREQEPGRSLAEILAGLEKCAKLP